MAWKKKSDLLYILVLGAVLALGFGIRSWRSGHGLDLQYTVFPTETNEFLRVELRMDTGESDEPIVLRAIRHDLHLVAEDVQARTHDGKEIPFYTSQVTVPASNHRDVSTTQYIVPASGGGETIVSYKVRSSAYRLSPECGQALRYSVQVPGFVATTAASLLLAPMERIGTLDVSVDARTAQELGYVATGDLLGTSRPGWADRNLGERTLIAGRVAPSGVQDAFQLVVSPEFDVREQAEIRTWVSGVAEHLESWLGAPAQTLRVLAVLPPQGAENLELAAGNPNYEFVEVSFSSGAGKEALATKLAAHWMGKTPRELEECTDADAWFQIGMAELAAHRALEAVGETWAGDAAIQQRFADVTDVDVSAKSIPTYEADKRPYFEARRAKSACLALFLDWELERTGERTIHDVWNSFSKGQGVEESSASLVPGIEPFFSRWVDGYSRFLSPFPFRPTRNPYDPVSRSESTDLTLIYTSQTQTYLESCGCKLNMSGGVTRRAARIREESSSPGAVVLDLGGFFPYATQPGDLDEVSRREIQFYLETMESMGYDAAVIGVTETLHGPEFFEEMTSSASATPYLSADLDLGGRSVPYEVLEKNGRRIGIVGVTGDPRRTKNSKSFDETLSGIDYTGVQGIASAIRTVRDEDVDLVVLAGRVTTGLLDELASTGSAPDLALDGRREPLWDDPTGRMPSIWIGRYGSVVVAREPLGSYGLTKLELSLRDGELAAEMEPIELEEWFSEDPELRGRLDQFYSSFEDDSELWGAFEPLYQWDPIAKQTEYVGVEQCRSCHADEYDQWRTTKHADAMRVLVQDHRNFNPKCVKCHVTGMGYAGGYQIGRVGHALENVQCEVCHGPGKSHLANPTASNIRRTPSMGVCLECHNPEHSDLFEDRYHQALESVSH